MNFEPQNKLEEALVRAATDPAARPDFYRQLLQSDIFIIQHGKQPPVKEERITLAEHTQVQIAAVEFNGKRYTPFYSSLARLQATLTQEAAFLGMNALEFFKLTSGSALLMNPGSQYGKEFTPAEVESIIHGSIWRPQERYVAKKATQVMIGQPKNHPTELIEALTRLFKKNKNVKRAWIAHFFNPERDEKSHTLVAIDAGDAFESVSADAGLVLRSVRIPDPPVDFLPITGRRS